MKAESCLQTEFHSRILRLSLWMVSETLTRCCDSAEEEEEDEEMGTTAAVVVVSLVARWRERVKWRWRLGGLLIEMM